MDISGINRERPIRAMSDRLLFCKESEFPLSVRNELVSQRKSGAILGYINILTKNIVNLLYTPLLLHFLGQADYGVFQMINSVVFALTLLSGGFYGAYVRFYTQKKVHGTEADIKRLNGMFLLVYIAVSVLCFIGGFILFLNTDNLFAQGLTSTEIALAKELIIVMVFNVIVTLLSTPFDSYIVVHERFVFQQSRQFFLALATPFFAVLLLHWGAGAPGVAVAQLIVSTVLLVLNIRFSVKRLGMKFSFSHLDSILFKEIAIFSFWIFLNQVSDLVNNQFPNFLLGAMSSATAVATFAIALQIRNIFFSMSTTMSSVFVPRINTIVTSSGDNQVLTKLMTRIGRYQMILFCYLLGGFALLGKYFVSVWAGSENSDAYLLALVMTLPVAIPLTQNLGIEIQRAENKHKARSLVYVATSILDILISVVLIPRYGYWATAIGYVVSIVLGTGLFMNWYYQTHIGLDMKYFWSKVGIIPLATAFITIGLLVITSNFSPITSLFSFIMWGIIYSLIFGVLAWFLFINKHEKNSILARVHSHR